MIGNGTLNCQTHFPHEDYNVKICFPKVRAICCHMELPSVVWMCQYPEFYDSWNDYCGWNETFWLQVLHSQRRLVSEVKWSIPVQKWAHFLAQICRFFRSRRKRILHLFLLAWRKTYLLPLDKRLGNLELQWGPSHFSHSLLQNAV